MIDPQVLEFDARRKAASVPAVTVCKRAKVSEATIWRWMNGGYEPLPRTLRKLNAALDAIISERASAFE